MQPATRKNQLTRPNVESEAYLFNGTFYTNTKMKFMTVMGEGTQFQPYTDCEKNFAYQGGKSWNDLGQSFC